MDQSSARARFPGGERYQATGKVITARHRSQQALTESEAFGWAVFEASPDCIKIIDAAGKLERINANGQSCMEIDDCSAVIGHEWASLWPEQEHGKLEAACAAARAGGVGRFSGYCPTAKGDPRWWDVTISAIPGNGPSGQRLLVSSRDVTQRNRAQEALRDNSRRLRVTLESSHVTLAEQDRDLRYNWIVNPKLGYSEAETVGRSDEELMAPEPAAIHMALKRQVIETGTAVRQEVIAYAPGQPVEHFDLHVEPRLDASNTIIGLTSAAVNITERKQAADALAQSEKRLATALAASHAGVWTWDMVTGDIVWTPENFALLGLDPAHDVASIAAWKQRLHPEDAEATITGLEASETQGNFRGEFRVVHPDGEIRWLLAIANIERDDEGMPRRMFGLNLDITERKRAEDTLRESEERFARAQRAANIGTWDWDIGADNFVWTAETWNVLCGLPEPDGVPSYDRWLHSVHPEDREFASARVTAAMDGTSYLDEFRVCHPGGRERWVESAGEVLRGDNGEAIRMLGTVRDITERKHREEQAQILLKEVNHRAKNMLAVVQSVARQSAATDVGEFLADFGRRIQAMATNQDLLVRNEWKAVPVEDLVRVQTSPFSDPAQTRFLLSGPAINLTPAAAQTISMALHELATNAAKYGALSNDAGHIAIAWNVLEIEGASARFTMSWREQGGPPVSEPARRGFGSLMIDRMVKTSFAGEVTLDYAPDGVRWSFACAAGGVLEGGTVPSAQGAAAKPETMTLAARARVLVVEDEPLIAMETAAIIEDAGFEVLGPVGTVEQALILIEDVGCEFAVLDTNLGSESAEPVAELLRASGIAFVVTSGYSREQQPPAMRDAPILGKPVRGTDLLAQINRAFALV